jgi:hypothetical protein
MIKITYPKMQFSYYTAHVGINTYARRSSYNGLTQYTVTVESLSEAEKWIADAVAQECHRVPVNGNPQNTRSLSKSEYKVTFA